MTGRVLVIEALWQLLVNQKMGVPQRHIEKKNDASLFLAFAACSRCSCCTGCRDCEAFNPFYDFVCFETKWASQPLSPVLSRLRLEMNYKLMIWSLGVREIHFCRSFWINKLTSTFEDHFRFHPHLTRLRVGILVEKWSCHFPRSIGSTTLAKKIVTAEIFMRLIRSAIMWYLATSTSICNASSRRAATASRVAVEPKLDIARYHMIGPSINLMNFSAVTIFLARVV